MAELEQAHRQISALREELRGVPTPKPEATAPAAPPDPKPEPEKPERAPSGEFMSLVDTCAN